MKKNFSFLFILVFFGIVAQNQQPDSITRPKIGLVLSGGGAKGLAHIGVLKTLEKHHIRPDYIAGTSMGAIVGSMYAAGYSARQIDSIFHTLDFDKILFDYRERKYTGFFKKKNGPKYIFKLPFSLKKMSVQMPKGLASAQNLYNTLAENLIAVNDTVNFNRLKIPFICIATDIENGNQVLFNKGWLALAVTTSALLPTVYKPVEFDSKLLLDGGIVNNYPVKELRDMGAQIIIGSDVQGKILKKEQIEDIQNIMDQIISFQVYKEMPLKKLETDIYIHPYINDIGITEFEKIDTIIKRGIKATDSVLKKFDIEKLKKNSDISSLKFVKPDSISFDKIIINGLQNYRRSYVLGKLGFRPHKKISYKDYLEGINNLIGTDNFARVFYHIKNISNHPQLIIDLKEKENKAYINLGFHFNNLYKINVIGNFERKHLLTKNDLLSFDIIGGEKTRFNLDYLIDNGFGWNIGWHTGYHRFNTQVRSLLFFENPTINRLDLNVEQLQNKLSFEGSLNHFINFSIGLQHLYKRYYTNVFSGENNGLPYFIGKNHYVGTFANLMVDNRDDFDFPQKGIFLLLSWNYFPVSSDYYRNFIPYSMYRLKLEFTQNFVKKFYFQPIIQAGYIYAKKTSYENDFYLGGDTKFINFDNMAAFPVIDPLEVRATKYLMANFNLKYQLFPNHYLKYGYNYLFYDQSHDFPGSEISWISGHLIAYEYKSFLGPIRLSYARVPKEQKNIFLFSFGYDF